MNILFMSLSAIRSVEERGIYPDLLREFIKRGHYVRIVSPIPGEPTRDIRREGHGILQVSAPKIQKVGYLKKGIATLRIGPIIRRALERHCADERYDLILMATPPITLSGVVGYVKQRDGARFYLLLKDIWPQGIADLGAISQGGPIYRYYRRREKQLYALADHIGCMSRANVDYLLRHNPEISVERVEVCPNSIEPTEADFSEERWVALRERYGIPADRTVFLYGGNLGRPQGIPFMIDCLRRCGTMDACFFVICGTGTEFSKLSAYVTAERPPHVLLINGLPWAEYEELASACDVGLLFLDYRFSIPNFPSRLLTYMEKGLPVIACTDPHTDVGAVVVNGGFGWQCRSNDPEAFARLIGEACRADRAAMGTAARAYLLAHYTAAAGYRVIIGGEERF